MRSALGPTHDPSEPQTKYKPGVSGACILTSCDSPHTVSTVPGAIAVQRTLVEMRTV